MASNKGTDIALKRNLSNGLFDIDWTSSNDLKFSDAGEHYVLSVILEYKGKWWADSSGKRGSLLYTIKQDTTRTAAQIKAALDDALSQGVAAGKLSSFTTVVSKQTSGRYNALIQWSVVGGTIQQTILSL